MKMNTKRHQLTNTIFVILFLSMAIFASGCASITKGTKDTMQIQVGNCPESINCTAQNKKGTWIFTAPGAVQFKKSDDPLTITCDDGPGKITVQVVPQRGSMAWGNIIVGGIIGGGVDSSTDAHWDIADSLVLSRKYCAGKLLN